ncbi:NADH:flavin oxidoreductase [Streptomyces avermitilis]|uniref:NADH:flavin oxidoreductase n=1 Tax=Streptomyces avermitilis TaxID=33903 RepID=UPI0033FD657A
MTTKSPLFSPVTIGTLTLPNRIVMAPMTRQLSPNGVPGPDSATYYARRARGGAGLVITEGTTLASSAGPEGAPHFHGAGLEGWAAVVQAVHAEGGRIFPQLWHVGAFREPGTEVSLPTSAAGPSGLDGLGESIAEPMTTADIDRTVEEYGRAAADARRLGFDGVELHGAHGFLIDQFLWPHTNRRTDGYGGTSAGRVRFAAEVVAAVRAAAGPDFPISLRLSQWKMTDFTARLAETPQELEDLLLPLTDAGVDAFHLSTRRFWLPEFEGSERTLASWTKKLTGVPVIAVGSVGLAPSDFETAFAGQPMEFAPVDRAEELVENGDIDLLAVGRMLISDPEWPAKIRDGRTSELQAFDPSALMALV